MDKSKSATSTARIPPMSPDEWSESQRTMLESAYHRGVVYNLLGTLARHPDASRSIGELGSHVMGRTSTLQPRERELLILRTAWLCQAEYEWAQHVLLARKAGLDDAAIERCRAGPEAQGWSEVDACLLRAADELHAEQRIADATWSSLARHYDTRQLMDIVFAVGQYTLIAMALKTFGTPLDAGLEGF